MQKREFLEKISYQAGDILLKHYLPLGVHTETKIDNSPVTLADTEINQMVIDETQKYFPDYGVLGEEDGFNQTNQNLLVVDPLDGTKMFAMGSPLFAFSAAFVETGIPVAGVLYNPLAKRLLIAERGMGTIILPGKTPMRVSMKKSLKDAVIDNGWDSTDTLASSFIHSQGGFTSMIYTICEASSLVAAGGFDGIIFTGKKPWDMAAAKIIVEEAGGKVTDLFGNEQVYNSEIKGAILSNGHIHDLLVKGVKESGLLDYWK
jgi:myo-inositol-1(or 4)-monophosphatase